jgi:MscS family membrane protein
MEEAMSILKQIAKDNAHVSDNPDVFFESYGDFALGITFIYYIVKDASIFETQSEINLEILRRFSDAGLEFAFPSQTIYVEKSI